MSSTSRRSYAIFGSAIAIALFSQAWCSASEYPVRPVRLIVPFAASGGADVQARTVAQKLSEALGKQVVVDNRGGAGGVIGYDLVARAAPDGYTLTYGSLGLAVLGNYVKLPFDPATAFSPISLLTLGTNVLVVHSSFSARSVNELLVLAKSNPGKLNFAHAGEGSPMHLGGVLFNNLAKVELVGIPYKGGGPALTGLMGHEVDMLFGALIQIMPTVATGKLRPIAVTTVKRSALLPNVPTVAESGLPGYEFNAWGAIFAPRGTPETVTKTLNAQIVRIMSMADVQKRLAEAEPTSSTTGELDERLGNEIRKWRVILRPGLREK